jgi:hypothetical protein
VVKLDSEPTGVGALGEVSMRVDGLFVARQRIAVGPAVVRLLPCLPAVCQGLVPDLAPQGMVGEPSDLVGQAVSIERLQGLDDARVQHPPPPQQEAVVGHLLGEGMLEGVVRLGEQSRLIQELPVACSTSCCPSRAGTRGDS